MVERLWEILKEPELNNITQTVVIKLLDGTNPFLFIRDPIAHTWLIFRESEKDIAKALGSPASYLSSDKESEIKGDENSNTSIFPDVQLVEIESESVFIDLTLGQTETDASESADPLDARVTLYQRLKYLLEKKD